MPSPSSHVEQTVRTSDWQEHWLCLRQIQRGPGVGSGFGDRSGHRMSHASFGLVGVLVQIISYDNLWLILANIDDNIISFDNLWQI